MFAVQKKIGLSLNTPKIVRKIFQLLVLLVFYINIQAQTQIAVCPQIANFSSMTRGYYFISPCDFTICGLYVPVEMSTANQSVAVVRFTAGIPPTWGLTTNSFVQLFYQPNYPINGMIPCNIPINAGDIIGVYGSRGTAANSYGSEDCPTTILGNPVTLYRSGMQYDLATTPMQEIWYEDFYIGRVFMYIDCCPTADFTVTTPICLGQTATVTYTGSGNPPAATFNWTFPGGVPASANTVGPHTITYSTPGTKTVNLSVSQTACTTVSSSHTIVVNDNPTVAITPTAPHVCAGSSVIITASGANTYSWSGGLGTNPAQTVSPTATTTYTVTGTSTGGCTGTASVTVTMSPNLNVAVTPSTPSICNGASVNLTAAGATTYAWSGGLGAGATKTVSPTTTTTYTVTGSDAFGCTGTASVTVTVNPNPIVVINPTSAQTCGGNTIAITAGGANTYSWSGGLGTNANQNVSPTATTTYSVTGTDVNGCSGSASVIVSVYSNPVITASADPAALCIGSSSTLTAGGGSAYQWNSGDTAVSCSVSPIVTTTYSVTGTDVNGCTGTAQVVVDVYDGITASINPSDPMICEGDNIQMEAIPNSPGFSYDWSSGQATAIISVDPPSTTVYSVLVTDDQGCTGTAESTVTVNTLPVADFLGLPLEGCMPVTVAFQSTGSTGTYHWSFGDGGTASSGNPSHQYSQSGIYDVTLSVTDANGCSDELAISDYVEVYPMPDAGFVPSSDLVYLGESTVFFTDMSVGASSWYWNFGNNIGFSVSQNPEYTYNIEGTYTVWQYVENQWGCSDSASSIITVKPVISFYIPNAFSPNGDGQNDYFMPYGNNLNPDEYQMLIYDRWGRQLFRSDNMNTPWDGTSIDSGNEVLSQGIYNYLIKVKIDGNIKIFRGVVALIW